MGTISDVLYCARDWIGYSRWTDPEEGTVFGRWFAEKTGEPYFGASGVPYCAMFASYCLDWAGVACAGMPSAYCPDIVSAGEDAEATVSCEDAEAGDIVLFDWGRDGLADHVGIVEENHPGEEYMTTIEGNTSSGAGGSQSNGGVVARRQRGYGSVRCVVRPDYNENQEEEGTGLTEHQEASPAQLDVDGYWGRETTLRLQEYFDCPYRDGVISSQWAGDAWRHAACTSFQHDSSGEGSVTIARIQQQLGVTADGLCGNDTINALIDRFMSSSGATVLDGQLDAGSITVQAMQRALNEGTF